LVSVLVWLPVLLLAHPVLRSVLDRWLELPA
jgi:hypothetical protein